MPRFLQSMVADVKLVGAFEYNSRESGYVDLDLRYACMPHAVASTSGC